MLDNIKAAIFDMDGTLIDSMWVWSKIDTDYLNKKGIPEPKDLLQNIQHLGFEETAMYFKKRFHLTDSIEVIKNEWNEMAYHEYAHNVPLKPYAKEYLAYLVSKGIKISLATSNSTLLLQAALKKNNIYHFFDSITTTDEVGKGKNFPDVYLLAAQKLDIPPHQCIVFEDILPAVIGAKAAGMKVTGVFDKRALNHGEIKAHSDYYILNYKELLPINESMESDTAL